MSPWSACWCIVYLKGVCQKCYGPVEIVLLFLWIQPAAWLWFSVVDDLDTVPLDLPGTLILMLKFSFKYCITLPNLLFIHGYVSQLIEHFIVTYCAVVMFTLYPMLWLVSYCVVATCYHSHTFLRC